MADDGLHDGVDRDASSMQSPMPPWMTSPDAGFEYDEPAGSSNSGDLKTAWGAAPAPLDGYDRLGLDDVTPEDGSSTPESAETLARASAPVPAFARTSARRPRLPMLAAIAAVLVVAGIAAVRFLGSGYASDAGTPRAISFSQDGIVIDEASFPDEGMRAYVIAEADANGNGVLSDEEAAAITSMYVYGAADISGLSIFPNLAELRLRGTGLATVDLSDMPALASVDVAGAEGLRSLRIRKAPALEAIDCSNCLSLEELTLENVPALVSLDARGTALARLDLPADCSIEDLQVNPRTYVTGVPEEMLIERRVVDAYDYTISMHGSADEKHISIKAEYDDEGYIVRKTVQVDETLEAYSQLTPDCPSGTVEYAYDDAKRLKTVTVSGSGACDGEWAFEYGDLGRTVIATGPSMQGADGSYFVKERFDARGNLVSSEYVLPGPTGSAAGRAEFSYDDEDRLTMWTVSTGGGEAITNVAVYDAAGTLHMVNSDGGANATGGQGISTVKDSSTTYEFDARGRFVTSRSAWFTLIMDYGPENDFFPAGALFSTTGSVSDVGAFSREGDMVNGEFYYGVDPENGVMRSSAHYATLRVAPWMRVQQAAEVWCPVWPFLMTDPWLGAFGNWYPYNPEGAVALNQVWLATHTSAN